MERQKAGPRANRSKKTLPAAFCSRESRLFTSPPHVPGETVPGVAGAAGDVGGAQPTASSSISGWHGASVANAGAEGDRREAPAIRLDSLVFVGSCPQRHGHAVLKKMLHPPTLGLYCLVEIPGADHQRERLRESLQEWLRHWCALQVERPDLLVAVREAFWDAPQGYPMGILCEYMPLGSLDELVQACGGLPEEALREVAQVMLEALHALHSVQPPVVHGCLKPSQVLLSVDGRPRLAFGLEQRLKCCQAALAAMPQDAVGYDGAAVTMEGFADAALPSAGVGQQSSTTVDIFDLGLLLLVSALGGMDVLLDAIPYAREFGPRPGHASSGGVGGMGHVSQDTCMLLQQELGAGAAAEMPPPLPPGAEAAGQWPSAGSTMGYLPPASDLLFNRRYSEHFLAFVTTCLEAHTRPEPVSARDLLGHEFLWSTAPTGPIVTLREMQELARVLNEAADPEPGRFGPGKSSRSQFPGIAPSVVQSAQMYLANIAQAIVPYWGPAIRGGGRRRTLGDNSEVQVQPSRRLPQHEWEILLMDSARTLGLPRAVVQRTLEAQIDSILESSGAGRRDRADSGL